MKYSIEWLIKSFLKGLLLVVPLAVTLWVLFAILRSIDGLLRLKIPGLGFVITILIILGVGVLGSNILVSRFVAYLEKVLNQLPLVKLIYFSLKDLIGAFVGERKSFRFPVLVTVMPGSEAKMLGFVTARSMEIPGAQEHIAVYIPHSYNFSGMLVLVPPHCVTPLPPEESARWMAFIVSGGVSRGRQGEGNIGGEDFSTAKFPKV